MDLCVKKRMRANYYFLIINRLEELWQSGCDRGRPLWLFIRREPSGINSQKPVGKMQQAEYSVREVLLMLVYGRQEALKLLSGALKTDPIMMTDVCGKLQHLNSELFVTQLNFRRLSPINGALWQLDCEVLIAVAKWF